MGDEWVSELGKVAGDIPPTLAGALSETLVRLMLADVGRDKLISAL